MKMKLRPLRVKSSTRIVKEEAITFSTSVLMSSQQTTKLVKMKLMVAVVADAADMEAVVAAVVAAIVAAAVVGLST